jgi:two-component system, OmpR family, sensor kinase
VSLRTRLFGTYALVIAISLAIVAITTTAALQGYRDRLTMDRLDNMARPIAVQVRSLAAASTTVDRLWANLEEQAQNNGVYIIISRRDGNLVRQMAPTPDAPQIAVPAQLVPKALLRAQQGTFKTSEGRIFVYAAYPLGRLQAVLPVQAETLIVALPRAGSLALLAGLMVPLLTGGLAALLVSLVLALVFARSFSRPLTQIAAAAQKISKGDYSQKVPVEGPGEMQELARNFNHMTDEVKRSQLQLRHFVADVSHELKSPLTSIQGFSQALADGTANDETTKAKAIGIINSESKRMRRQVDELLDLSRMQSGQFRMSREPTDLSGVLLRCCEIFSMQAAEKGVSLTRRLPAGVALVGDADRLEQLFCNLIDNAVKNTQSGGEVEVGAESQAGTVTIRVSDNGPGIPQEQLPYVFERFYQVTGVRTGVGLGLAIAREIARAHGGTIEARSEPGEGAEFIVTLPATEPPV